MTKVNKMVKAKERVLKAMTMLITRKGEGANGWYSKMVSAYDVVSLFRSKGINTNVKEVNTIVDALIEDKMVRYYRIPNTNYISLGLTLKYFDLMDEMCDALVLTPAPVDEVPTPTEKPAEAPKRKRGRPRKNVATA